MANKITLKQTIASNPTTIRGQSCNLTASPDGKYLLYPSGQNIIMRDIDNPNECKVMAEHGKRCTVARYSPNGQWVASADEAGKIKIWTPFQEDDLVYKLKYEWHYLAGEIKDLAWCGENKRIVVAGDGQGNCANAFMFDTGSKLGDFVGISKRLNSCDIRKQKPFKTLVGGDDFSSVFYEGPPVKFIKTNKSFDKYVTCVRFNNAGDKYAAAGANGKIFVYDGETADNPVELTAAGAHSAGCYAVCWSPDDSKLVSCSADKTVKIWDMSSMSEIASISVGSNLGDQQLGVVWAPNGQIISVSLDGSLNYIQFDGNSASLSKKILGHSNSISCIDKLADGTLVAGSGFSNECYNYSTNFDAQKMTDGHKEKACLVSCHARQDHGFMTIAIDNSIKFGQSDYTGDESEVSARPEASDSCAETGQTVIACNESLALMLNKDVVDEVKLSYKPSCVAINKFGQCVVSGDGTETVKYFDCSSNKFVEQEPFKINGGASALKFNNAGTILAAGDRQDKAIRLMDAQNNFKVKVSNFPHSSKILALSWSPDDKYLASSELSNNLAAWNTEAGKRKVVVKHCHRMAYVNGFAWLDGHSLVSAGQDGLMKVWDVSF